MNLTHLHLLLNHFPTIGTLVAIGLFVGSLVRKHDDVKRVSFAIFFGIALISIPTYMTGSAAQEAIKGVAGVSAPLVAAHQDAALLAFIVMEIMGCAAWYALWEYRRNPRWAGWVSPVMLVLSVVSFVLMATAANLGGEIRHPEIQVITEGPPASWISAAGIGGWVTGTPWVWPASETLHFIGLCLLFGVVMVINLRMLGIIRNVSFAALHRLLPFGILGFLINSITGMLFFLGTPEQYTGNIAFYWKVIFILIAGVDVLYFTVFDQPWDMGPGDEAPFSSKAIAAFTIFLWVGIMYCGRMLPYIGNSF